MILAAFIFIAGISTFLFLKLKSTDSNFRANTNVFVSEEKFKTNLAKQLEWTPKTLEKLKVKDVSMRDQLQLSYFFYSIDIDKAKILVKELSDLHYSSEVHKNFFNKTQFIISGKTTPIKMSKSALLSWTKKMCELGYQLDCDFDGWEVQLDSTNTVL
jgi:hypothetical protein